MYFLFSERIHPVSLTTVLHLIDGCQCVVHVHHRKFDKPVCTGGFTSACPISRTHRNNPEMYF